MLVRPTGYIEVGAAVTKDEAKAFLLDAITGRGRTRSKFTHMLTDNGGEFGQEYEQVLVKHGIAHITSAPYSPQSHGRAEAAVRIIKGYIKLLLARLDLPLHFWPWVVQGAAEIYNKTPRSSSPDPYTMEYGKPDRRLVPGDPVVYQTEKRQTMVGAYLGDRHAAARLVARCDPLDWNSVTIHVFNPKWTQAVPIVGFENA